METASIIVNTFSDLRNWADAFAYGDFRAMLIVGKKGLSKTTTFVQSMTACMGESDGDPSEHYVTREDGERVLIKGAPWQMISARLSAFELFRQAYLFRDKPILIDDVDALLADRQTVALLKGLLQDEENRRLTWFSNAVGENVGIPNTFFTSSPVCILANDIGKVSEHLEAVLDRCKVVEFRPTVPEVVAQVKGWFDDAEVMAFVEEWEPFIPDGALTMRQVKHAHDLRASTRVSVDWRATLLSQWGVSAELVAAAKIKANKDLKTKAQKADEFRRLGGGSPATLYRLLGVLKAAEVRK